MDALEILAIKFKDKQIKHSAMKLLFQKRINFGLLPYNYLSITPEAEHHLEESGYFFSYVTREEVSELYNMESPHSRELYEENRRRIFKKYGIQDPRKTNSTETSSATF
jgi:hypothetical protein